LSSSQHHYEEHHGADVQHQVGSPAPGGLSGNATSGTRGG
jgi:hypothetical protein